MTASEHLIPCRKHGCLYAAGDWCPQCKAEYLEAEGVKVGGMIKYPDPEQHDKRDEQQQRRDGEKALLRALIASLQESLDTAKRVLKVLIHDRDALRRERDTVLQALANQVCPPVDGPSKIRMDPKEGIQGWCESCEEWHNWEEWVR